RPRAEIRAAGPKSELGTLAPIVAPEVEDTAADLGGTLRMKGAAVEERSDRFPRFEPEAEAVGQPEVVEAEIAREVAELPSEKGAQARAVWNARRITGVASCIAFQDTITADEARAPHGVGEADFAVPLVLEARGGEFAARVERRADLYLASRLPRRHAECLPVGVHASVHDGLCIIAG